MSATLVHQNPSHVSSLDRDSRGLSVITPVMAVSVCRPAIVDGAPSRSGSAAVRHSRHSSARSLPSRHHLRLVQGVEGSLPVTINMSSSLPQPHPPTNEKFFNEKDTIINLPKIHSPIQLCGNSNIPPNESFMSEMPPVEVNNEINITPKKPSTFPNFRALQRLAASAKLRINALKSKESNIITTALMRENQTLNRDENNENKDSVLLERLHSNGDGVTNILDTSWSSQDDDDVQESASQEESKSKGNSKFKSKKTFRSRSRRKGTKSGHQKKRKPSASPASFKDGGSENLGNFSLASSITLNNRLENKKIETFSMKYNSKTNNRRSKTKATTIQVTQASRNKESSPKMQLTSVALDKRPSISVHGQHKEVLNASLGDKSMPTPRMVIEQAATVYGTNTQVSIRLSRTKAQDPGVIKIFLSEKQSNTLKECGKIVPCAPPTSPTPEQLLKFEYVPSLTDLRSQRALKDRLNVMDAEEKKRKQKLREERARHEKQMMRSNACHIRTRQRQEIYALNKVMSELEHQQFLQFCESMKKEENGKT